MELHHHEVDGRGPAFMDWPSTAGYCAAIARTFGIPILYSSREGGLLRLVRQFEAQQERQQQAIVHLAEGWPGDARIVLTGWQDT